MGSPKKEVISTNQYFQTPRANCSFKKTGLYEFADLISNLVGSVDKEVLVENIQS